MMWYLNNVLVEFPQIWQKQTKKKLPFGFKAKQSLTIDTKCDEDHTWPISDWATWHIHGQQLLSEDVKEPWITSFPSVLLVFLSLLLLRSHLEKLWISLVLFFSPVLTRLISDCLTQNSQRGFSSSLHCFIPGLYRSSHVSPAVPASPNSVSLCLPTYPQPLSLSLSFFSSLPLLSSKVMLVQRQQWNCVP